MQVKLRRGRSKKAKEKCGVTFYDVIRLTAVESLLDLLNDNKYIKDVKKDVVIEMIIHSVKEVLEVLLVEVEK